MCMTLNPNCLHHPILNSVFQEIHIPLTVYPANSYVSPRSRAQRTLELLEIGCRERLPWRENRKAEEEEPIRTEARVEITEAVREWDYGDYEGLTSKQIRESRAEKGLEPWNIWTDGCPGGE